LLGCRYKFNGFTLVELALVLVLVGIMISIGASMIGPLTKRAKLSETRDIVSGDVEGVIGFAATNKGLPANLAAFRGVVRSPNDAWGRSLTYIPASGLLTANSICRFTSTNLSIQACNSTTCTPPQTVINNVAFLVMSNGDNTVDQTTYTPPTYRSYQPGILVAGNEYDDIVKWVTLPELKAKFSCGCTAYEVYNNLGSGLRYFQVGTQPACLAANNATLIVSLGPGGSVRRFLDANCSNATAVIMDYVAAKSFDDAGDVDCLVNISGSDR
jgi:prepilin-type N-terminal cleavage/methylation domain-containing protein